MEFKKILKKIEEINIESNIDFKLKLSDETIWEDVFNKLEYKSVLCCNSFIQYQYIYNLSFEKTIYDISIILFFKKKPIGLLPLFYLGSNNSLSYINNDTDKKIFTPFFLPDISDEIKDKALISTFKFLFELKEFLKIHEIKIYFTNPFLKKDLNLSNLNNNFKLLENYDLYLDLSNSVDDIKKKIRKSYISIINKEKSIKINVFDETKNDEKIWLEFKDLHLQVSKRKTRSDESWNKQFKNLCDKKAFFFYLEKNNKLIAGSFFDVTNDEAHYSGSVFNEEARKNNISHFIQYAAIKFFKNKKIKWYYLGKYISKIDELNTKKDLNISFFKKGFSSSIVKNPVIVIS